MNKVAAGEVAPHEALALLDLMKALPQEERPPPLPPGALRNIVAAIYNNGP